MTDVAYDLSELGEAGIVLTVLNTIDLDAQERIWVVADALPRIKGIEEVLIGVNNLTCLFDPDRITADEVSYCLTKAWDDGGIWNGEPAIHEIPVTYGGEAGPDLEELSAYVGMTPQEVIELHTGSELVVMAVGAQPGYGYLGGMDPRLAMPRKAKPRERVPAGSVIIGGAQTAVATSTSPNGWNVIGFTDWSFFDPANARPARLSAGDRVRFIVKEAQDA